MQLTLYTDYSLRMLIYLERVPPPQLTSIKEIATAYQISYHHLTKVAHELAKLGLIESIKGRNGGVRLAKEPSEINIGWVVRHTEDNLTLVECFDDHNNQCMLKGHCRLKGILSEALQAFLQVLDKYTLADLTIHPSMLEKLFSSPNNK